MKGSKRTWKVRKHIAKHGVGLVAGFLGENQVQALRIQVQSLQPGLQEGVRLRCFLEFLLGHLTPKIYED